MPHIGLPLNEGNSRDETQRAPPDAVEPDLTDEEVDERLDELISDGV
jgi:hypothetical protein